jgi:hypothetical protein
LRLVLAYLIFADKWVSALPPFTNGGMDASMISRMKELEEENRRLKKMYLEDKLKAEIVSKALEKKW